MAPCLLFKLSFHLIHNNKKLFACNTCDKMDNKYTTRNIELFNLQKKILWNAEYPDNPLDILEQSSCHAC